MKCLEKRPEDRFKNGKELYNYVLAHKNETAPAIGINEDSSAKDEEIEKYHERISLLEKELDNYKITMDSMMIEYEWQSLL